MTTTATVLILRGAPGSGKSTWANTWRQADPQHREIVNRDQLRHQLFGRYRDLTQQQEDIVTAHQIALAENALSNNMSIVVDDTNLQRSHLATWTAFADRHHVPHQIITLDTPLDECLNRNRRRAAAGGRFVPEHVIRQMHRTAQTPE